MRVIYQASRNADSTEGRGPMVPIAVFESKADAIAAAKGQGVMGFGDGEVTTMRVYSSIAEWEEGELDGLRKRALAKLSEVEKKALGLLPKAKR